MKTFNLGSRIELFAICTSLEQDIKTFILKSTSEVNFSNEMKEKALFRKKDCIIDEDYLNQLDMQDYIDIIINFPYHYQINNDKAKDLSKFFEKIIPIRNRIMHTKPLELGDRALILEIMETIPKYIEWIEWNELTNIKKILEEDPSLLLSKKYIPLREYKPLIIHNLPEAEFDDTGFIGRERDRKEIKDLIENKKNQVITIVGNGGVGKTATVVKILYDLIDDPKCEFEFILWITLKTKTLSNGEFIQLKNSLSNIKDIFNFSHEFILTAPDDGTSSKELLLEFMSTFKTLMVLDNLETINTNEINEFIKEVPEKSKILITSRHGLGELERRKKLDGLEKMDTILYFRELSKYYGLDLHKRSDKEIYDITGNFLFSNPLSIKWYISGIFNGMGEKELKNKKDELINFCVSNIFEKLNETSKNILQLFLLEQKPLSYGVIDFYIEANEVTLKQSINELLTTYMINSIAGEFKMNDMSREYISINFPPRNDFVISFFKKRKALKIIMQSVKIISETSPFNPKAICSKLTDDDKQLATYYLQEALIFSRNKEWENANKMCDKAKNIAPDFFEVYKIQAFIDAEHNEYYGAIKNYEIALSKANTNKEKAIVYYLFAVFYTIKMEELDTALEYILKADELLPNTVDILLDKARIFMYHGKFSEAESFLNEASTLDNSDSLKIKNIIASRYADLYKRKAEYLENRDYKKKFEYLKTGIEYLEKVEELDIKSGVTMIILLLELSYLYFETEAMELLARVINKHFALLTKIIHYKKNRMCDFLKSHKEEIPEKYFTLMEPFINHKMIANDISNKNEGVVVNIKDYFGFISNQEYQKSFALFFVLSNAYEGIKIGDVVSFSIYDSKKGKCAKNIKKIE